MYSFLNDYSEGAHPRIMDALMQTNMIQTVGYGEDEYCQKARDVMKKRMHRDDADIHFLVGGTQTNMAFLTHVLRDYEAVIATDEGHIHVHETGAVEFTGHKVLTIPHVSGKITVAGIDELLSHFGECHMVKPRVVYISQTTELGTYYTKKELEDLYDYTQKHDLYLFVDGARLGSAIVLEDAPSLEELVHLCDSFYIGGTKMGLLFGEALVILHPALQSDFRFTMKQKGAMLAKGRLLGIQFYEVFKDELYEEIGAHENALAMRIQKAFMDIGAKVYLPSSTNQIFVDVSQELLDYIEKEYMVTHIGKFGDLTRIRLVTSFATKEETVEDFVGYLHIFQ